MAYERTWAFSFDNVYAATSALDHTRYQLWGLKAMLCGQLGGLTSGLWSVYSSCDSVTAGNADGPGVDRWASGYNGSLIVRGAVGANPKSWVVLKSPSMNGVVFYLIIDFEAAVDTDATLHMCKTAPTGGTTTARPTSTDEWVVGASGNTAWNAGTNTPHFVCLNIGLSSTGDFWYAPVDPGTPSPVSAATFVVAVIAPVGCNGNDLFPIWTFRFYFLNARGALSANNLMGVQVLHTGTIGGTANDRVGVSTFPMLGENGSNIPAIHSELPDILTGKYATVPMYLLVNGGGTSAYWHWRGRLPDCFGMHSGLNSTNFPQNLVLTDSGGNITHCLCGNLFVPSNAILNVW